MSNQQQSQQQSQQQIQRQQLAITRSDLDIFYKEIHTIKNISMFFFVIALIEIILVVIFAIIAVVAGSFISSSLTY